MYRHKHTILIYFFNPLIPTPEGIRILTEYIHIYIFIYININRIKIELLKNEYIDINIQ
jgi:hypothetical protein